MMHALAWLIAGLFVAAVACIVVALCVSAKVADEIMAKGRH